MADLVQMECLRGLTRAVRVASGRQAGYLFFDQGQLVHAQLGGLSGERAAVTMLGWDAGTFHPTQRYFTEAPTIDKSWQALLLTAAQERDDRARRESESPQMASGSGEDAPATKPARSDAGRWSEGIASSEAVASAGTAGIAGLPAPEPALPTPPGRAPEVSRVRFDDSGAVLEGSGSVESLLEVAAYISHLAALIGEALGMPEVRAIECVRSARVLIYYHQGGSHVAVEGPPGGALLSAHAEAGFR